MQNLQSSHLHLRNHCDLGFYPIKPRRSPQRRCVSGALGPSTRPEPSILAFSRRKNRQAGLAPSLRESLSPRIRQWAAIRQKGSEKEPRPQQGHLGRHEASQSAESPEQARPPIKNPMNTADVKKTPSLFNIRAPLRSGAGELIERNGACRCYIQGIYLMIHGNAHREVARRNGVVAQAVAFGP